MNYALQAVHFGPLFTRFGQRYFPRHEAQRIRLSGRIFTVAGLHAGAPAGDQGHWPVSALLGIVDSEELPADLCSYIEQDIDDKQFSFVSTAEAFRVGIPVLASKNPPTQMA